MILKSIKFKLLSIKKCKRSENSIYWWYARIHPSEDEKEAVQKWLMENANLKTTPFHKWISQSNTIVKRHPDYYKNRWASHDSSPVEESIGRRLVRWILQKNN